MKVRTRAEHGFGLIELVMAMAILNIGILAIVAAFESGAFAVARAGHISSASALADSQMERYRALLYSQVALDSAHMSGLDNTYRCESVLGASCPNTLTTCSSGTCSDGTIPTRACGTANECLPTRSVSGAASPDHYPYRIDSYIVYVTPANGRQLKQVTVVVRDGRTLTRTLARLTSRFDQTLSG